MPTCAAINCTNNTGSGLKMSYFPLQDPERCAIWIKNVGRRQWEPTKNSVLCQWHFAPEMWQNRSDMLKLKNDAVPTLFGHLDNRLLEQIPTECSSKEAVHLNVMDNKVITEPEKNDSLISNESTIDLSSDNNSINTSGMTEESLAEDKDEFTQSDKMNYDGDCANCFELEKKLNKYQAMYNKMCLSQKKYKQAMRSLKLKNQRLEKNQVRILESEPIRKNLSKIINTDQLKLLNKEYKKVPQWSNETVEKAFRYRFTCGRVGYEELRKDMPLPSLKTLSRRLQYFNFDPGILYEIFDFLKIKIGTFSSEIDKDAMLIFDAMTITAGRIFDQSKNAYISVSTLPNIRNNKETATHALVFMLGGIASRWKQIVAYHFITNSVDGKCYKPIICEIIKKSEEIGLRIHGVTCDMGSANQAMWREFGIGASRYGKTKNFCTHPNDPTRKLFFFHDAGHGLKNLNQGLQNNKTIEIPQEVADEYVLPSTKVKYSDLCEFSNTQERELEFGLSLAPKLKPILLNSKDHFQKMKVNNSAHVFDFSVSSAMIFCSQETGETNVITTAWFYWFGGKVVQNSHWENPKISFGIIITRKI